MLFRSIKPNDGSRGALVEKVYSQDDVIRYLSAHKDSVQCVRIEKPLKGNEHRLFVVDGKIWFGYCRRPPEMTFDGQHDVRFHVQQQMKAQERTGKLTLDESSPFLREALAHANLTMTSIPSSGTKLPYSPAMNLSIGGAITDYSESFAPHLHEFVKQIADLFNLRVFGIDVYCEGPIAQAKALRVLEINGNPSMESAEQFSSTNMVDQVWSHVLSELFN